MSDTKRKQPASRKRPPSLRILYAAVKYYITHDLKTDITYTFSGKDTVPLRTYDLRTMSDMGRIETPMPKLPKSACRKIACYFRALSRRAAQLSAEETARLVRLLHQAKSLVGERDGHSVP